MISWPKQYLDIPMTDIEFENKINVNNFRKYGFSIWRNFLNSQEIDSLLTSLERASARAYHPVAHDLDRQTQLSLLSPSIRKKLADGITPLLGKGMGITGSRFLVKQEGDKGVVKTHQDLGYHIGSFEQVSIFSSLNQMSKENGGIRIIPGSHHLGYLGDAGTLTQFYPEKAELCPQLQPGDALIMHCALIHHSRQNDNSVARKVFEILLCPEEQPWRIDTVSESDSTTSPFGDLDPSQHQLFLSGRGQRLQKIRDILNQK